MSMSLQKGANISLSKADPNLNQALLGLGWDVRHTDGNDFDLDASIFLLGENGKVRQDHDFIFYNNLKSSDGSIEHTGDNRTGHGDGDDEAIKVNLPRVPQDVHKIIIAVTIHEADMRRQNFGMVENAFVRVVNQDSNQEIAHMIFPKMLALTAMVFGELYRHNQEWKFRAVGQGYKGGLAARQYGVEILANG
ncbi:MAG: TerD family protein [Deinococcales bacterium]